MEAQKIGPRKSSARKLIFGIEWVVPSNGVEPSLPCGNTDLNRARLPIPPRRHNVCGIHSRERDEMLPKSGVPWQGDSSALHAFFPPTLHPQNGVIGKTLTVSPAAMASGPGSATIRALALAGFAKFPEL